jgi:hypothetical protein
MDDTTRRSLQLSAVAAVCALVLGAGTAAALAAASDGGSGGGRGGPGGRGFPGAGRDLGQDDRGYAFQRQDGRGGVVPPGGAGRGWPGGTSGQDAPQDGTDAVAPDATRT